MPVTRPVSPIRKPDLPLNGEAADRVRVGMTLANDLQRHFLDFMTCPTEAGWDLIKSDMKDLDQNNSFIRNQIDQTARKLTKLKAAQTKSVKAS